MGNSNGKISFRIAKSCKTKDFKGGNAGQFWETLGRKYDTVPAQSLTKSERVLRKSKLVKYEEAEIKITNFKGIQLK
jgi:hypothetical protein